MERNPRGPFRDTTAPRSANEDCSWKAQCCLKSQFSLKARGIASTSGGYVLLVVIAVLVLLVTALSMFASASLRRGLRAADANRRLQVTWGQRSLSDTILARAGKVFDAREALYAEQSLAGADIEIPPPWIRDAVTLNGVTFDLLLGDEDAKLDLNLIYHQDGNDSVTEVLRKQLGVASAAVRLLPAVEPTKLTDGEFVDSDETSSNGSAGSASVLGDSGFEEDADLGTGSNLDDDSERSGGGESDEPSILRAFRSWGEVFDLPRLEAMAGSPDALPQMAADFTVAGSGRINLSRASDDAISATLETVLDDGAAQRLIERLRENPRIAVETLLQVSIPREENRQKLKRLLRKSSESYSLWVDVSTIGGHRQRQWNTARQSEDGSRRIERFAF